MKTRTLRELRAICRGLYREGKTVVLTNGCFDLLHAGHISYLQQARAEGDCLIVALNSDASVRALKGPDRPVVGERDRARVLSALECVDHVVLFGEKRVARLVDELKPCVWVKGGDYTLETIDPGERAALEACGARIVFVPTLEGRSTTKMLKRARG